MRLSSESLEENNDIQKNEKEIDNLFYDILNTDYLGNLKCDESGFLYICGYVSFKVNAKMKCNSCKCALINTNACDDAYFNDINRGKLSVPSDFVLGVCKHVLGIVQALVSKEYEEHFLLTNHQKNVIEVLGKLAVVKGNSLIANLHENKEI